MPIYEYSCQKCRRRFSVLVGVVAGARKPVCPRCGNKTVRKLISRIARVRPEESFDSLAGESDATEDFESPDSARRWAGKMSGEFGDELGEDFEGEVESALEEGEGESEEDEEL
jgi:putative FmdB family regulatory protein